jgi:hypothetical protein
MGNIDNLLANISDKPFRSSFDVTQAFYQIGMTPESKGVTFFVTRPSGSCIMKFNRSIQNGDFAAFCSTHNIEQMTTLPYKGQSNGRTEVQIRNFKHALQKHCLAADTKSTWPDEIWKIQLSLNTSASLATNATPELLLSDMASCTLTGDHYVCPKDIVHSPLNNLCVSAHTANDMPMIERHCSLTKTSSKNMILRLDDATVYYNFPKSENIIQTCQPPTIIKLQGQGIFEIPTSCSIATSFETFVNLSPPSIYRHQLNKIIPPLTLTDPEHANTFWNNARDEIGILALSQKSFQKKLHLNLI